MCIRDRHQALPDLLRFDLAIFPQNTDRNYNCLPMAALHLPPLPDFDLEIGYAIEIYFTYIQHSVCPLQYRRSKYFSDRNIDIRHTVFEK